MFGLTQLRVLLDEAEIFANGCHRALSFQSVVSPWPL